MEEAKLCNPVCSTFEALIVRHTLGRCCGEQFSPSVDQFLLQALQCSVHLISLLRCNGFVGIQKAVVDQTGSRPPNSDPDLFLVLVWLWKVLWNFLVSPLSWWLYKIHFSLLVAIQLRNCYINNRKPHFKSMIFDLRSAHEAPIYQAFSSFQFSSNAK